MIKKDFFYFNFILIAFGILIVFFGIKQITSKPKGDITTLKFIKVELSSDVLLIKGSENPNDYKFWIKEHEALFVIKDGGVTGNNRERISKLKKGEIIQIKISNFEQLSDKLAEIPVYGLVHSGQALLTIEDYIKNRIEYKKKLGVVMIFIGLMFLLNGIYLIRKKYNVIIISIFIMALIIMKVMNFGLY